MKLIITIIFLNIFIMISGMDLKEYYLQKIININTANNVYEDVSRFSKQYNIDPKLITAIIEIESKFNPKAISSKGAIGLMQIIPKTAKTLNIDPNIISQNIYGGIKYFSILLKNNNNDIRLALASYNAGMGNVIKYNSVPPFSETQNYIKNVLKIYEKLNNKKLELYSNEFNDTNFEWK